MRDFWVDAEDELLCTRGHTDSLEKKVQAVARPALHQDLLVFIQVSVNTACRVYVGQAAAEATVNLAQEHAWILLRLMTSTRWNSLSTGVWNSRRAAAVHLGQFLLLQEVGLCRNRAP